MKLRFISFLLALILAFGGCALAEALPVPTDVPLTEYTPISAEALKRVQQQLISLGILNDKADGIYGPKTEAALKAFQKSHGLTVDGVCGPATWTAITQPVETYTIRIEGATYQQYRRILDICPLAEAEKEVVIDE